MENEYAWKVSAEEIKQRNYNLDIKNPHAAEEQHQLYQQRVNRITRTFLLHAAMIYYSN